ncbi:hypothetical protein V6N13_073202 [Hibiscus sabdariffa]
MAGSSGMVLQLQDDDGEILYADCKLSEAVSLDNVLSGNAFQLLTQGGTGRAAVRVENQHGMPTRAH